jgi:hypothetical protein
MKGAIYIVSWSNGHCSADKANVIIVIATTEYNQIIAVHLEDRRAGSSSKMLSLWSTELLFSFRGPHFLRRFPYNLSSRVWAAKNLWGSCSLDAHCEHYWDSYLLYIQAPVRSAQVSFVQLPTLFEKVCSLHSSLKTISQDFMGSFVVCQFERPWVSYINILRKIFLGSLAMFLFPLQQL